MEEIIIDINNLPEGWKIEEGRKRSPKTGKKRIYILNEINECVGASCGKCGKVLVYRGFYKDKTQKFGIRSICKMCFSKEHGEYRKNNAEKLKEYRKEYRKNNAEKLKEYKKEYRKNNAEKIKEYRKNNAEKIKEYQKEYRKTNAEKIKEYYKTNAEKIKEYQKNNEEKIKEYQKEYRRNNPEKIRAKNHRRRTRKKGNGGNYTMLHLEDCLNFFNNCCAYTGEELEEGYHLDHIKPISKGGTSYIYNLVPATATANTSKGAKDLEEWYNQQPYYSEERLQKILEWQKIAFQKYNTAE